MTAEKLNVRDHSDLIRAESFRVTAAGQVRQEDGERVQGCDSAAVFEDTWPVFASLSA
jgi:hypothetical protein